MINLPVSLVGVLAVIIAVSLAVIYNKFVIKDYPHKNRIFVCVLSVIIFLISSVAVCGTIFAKNVVDLIINNKSDLIEQYVIEKFPNNQLVQNGFDLSTINQDASQSAKIISELKGMIPPNTELGMDKTLYDMTVDFAAKKLQKRLVIVDYSFKAANAFAAENNVLTVSSVIYNLKTSVSKTVSIISFIVAAIFVFILLVFIRAEGFNAPPFRAFKKGIKPRMQIPLKNNIPRCSAARLLIITTSAAAAKERKKLKEEVQT